MTTYWIEVGQINDIPPLGARTINTKTGRIALFRAEGDKIYALEDRCPHKNGPLSQGIVHDCAVTCPLHNWVIDLQSGEARGPDQGTVPTIPVKITDGKIQIAITAEATGTND
ncbi:MAG: nitrite reductase (NAD(P)H) small subunit [Kordiimonas sp.]|nr:nitrite reductase (NAD(P)H) small subunit [Kordiimonas sp.]|tara:strand:- start:373 stop:711 length:339 start_codon:yes stop_codon:yes gene_type:complete